MLDPWYEPVEPDVPLLQGDIISDCPIIGWSDKPVESAAAEALKKHADAFIADVVVMTQACDLEQSKVKNVVLCPHRALEDYKPKWEESMKRQNQEPSKRAWTRHYENLCGGSLWNLAILNCESDGPLQTAHRVVDFYEVYTVPRQFLESFLAERGEQRLRLRPPYREHLSQAFARFFMRVGLPTAIEEWKPA